MSTDKSILSFFLLASRRALLSLLIVHFTTICLPQDRVLKGQIMNPLTGEGCNMASVSLLKMDSSLIISTRSRLDGSFTILIVPGFEGKSFLLIEFPSCQTMFKELNISKGKILDVGAITLIPKTDSLGSVIVTSKGIRAHLKGDTLEYSTDNIQLRPNANVEDLLKRLPGLQIDKDGNITLNGKKIKRLLVDGEDLFADDPTIVTKNLNGDMISKVQVLEKKSEKAEFTGIDDGNRNMTLNLVLKQDAKNGYFGKLDAGGNLDDLYSTNGILGSFKKDAQLVALGIASNTGALGFSGNAGEGQGGLSVLNITPDALGSSAGAGIPKVIASGVHFSNKWNAQEDHFLGNFQYGNVFTQPISSIYNQQIIPGSIYTQNQKNESVNTQQQDILSALYDIAPDTLTAIRVIYNGLKVTGHNLFYSTGSSEVSDTLVNASSRSISSDIRNSHQGGSFFMKTKSRKRSNRNLSISLNFHTDKNSTNGLLKAENTFYGFGGIINSIDSVDQRKQISANGYFLSGNISYTERLWKNLFGGLSYDINNNQVHSVNNTYDKVGTEYSKLVDSLSDHFNQTQNTQQIGINLQNSASRFNYTVGGKLLVYSLVERDPLTDSVLKYHYFNFSPWIHLNYKANPYTQLILNYSANTIQPTVSQLQPLKNNIDPLHIVLGNPALHPSIDQYMSVNYKRLARLNVNIGMFLGITQNSISTQTTIDTVGRQVSQAVNSGGGWRTGVDLSLNRHIDPIGLDFGLSGNVNYNHTENYVNTDLSRNNNLNLGGAFSIVKNVVDKYSLQLYSQFGYFQSHSSVNNLSSTAYWSQSHYLQISLYPVSKVEFSTNAYFNWQQKVGPNNEVSVFVWNVNVSRIVTKNIILKFQGNNLLNVNSGISRSSVLNTITQSENKVIGRYFLISAIFRFKGNFNISR